MTAPPCIIHVCLWVETAVMTILSVTAQVEMRVAQGVKRCTS